MIHPFLNTTWQRYNTFYPELIGTGHFVAEGVRLIGDVQMHTYSSIWFNAVLRADNASIRIGAYSNVQDGAVIHTDADFPVHVGDYVTIGHQAIIHGCTIEHHVLVGMGAIIMDGAHIGSHSLIAAGALVPEGVNIPPYSLVVGMPAKVRRSLTEEEQAKIQTSALHYSELAQSYLASLSPVKQDE
jgi:carbonic anhydrase/acetyltransferase-like protein (isoleucine patch superfamily)